MVRLIDSTYFTKGERLVQNAPSSLERCTDQNEIAVSESIHGWIESVQEEFLTSMLGARMAKILLAYLDAKEMASQQEGIEEPEVDDELEFLADGLKESLADYVMYKMLRGTQLQMMNTGAVALKNANEHENTARRQASVWNTMVRRNLSFLDEARKRLSGYTISYVKNMVTTVNALNL